MTVATARFRGLRAVDGAGRSTAAASVKAAAAPAAEVVPEAAAAAAAAAEDEEEDGEEAAVRDFFLGRAAGAEGGREAGDDSAASAAGVSRAFLFDFIVRTRYCRTEEAFAWSLIAESTLVGANSSPALFLTLTCSDRTCGSRTSTACCSAAKLVLASASFGALPMSSDGDGIGKIEYESSAGRWWWNGIRGGDCCRC
jgi:hypothetical protein